MSSLSGRNLHLRKSCLKRFLLFGGLSLGVFWLDQETKRAILNLPQRTLEVTPFFNIVHVWNKGVGFGFLSQIGAMPLFVMIVGCALVFFFWRTFKESSYLNVGLYGLIVGGALGNLRDRFIHGAVFDFLDFYWGTAHFPAFNAADTSITLGGTLLVLFYQKEDNYP
ncbi:MAG: signal peptidase II [Holosporales bacterium]|jgi:signal peptidase II|nr:signal peptidase II [Holosporales bacterium]